MAEALLQRKGADRFVAASAGSQPSPAVHPTALEALAELGIDWSHALPKGLDAAVEQEWDFIITTCDRMREVCPTFPGKPIYAHWGVPDPSEAKDQRTAFQETLALLSWRLDLMLALRPEKLEQAAIGARLQSIGETGPHPEST